MFPAGAHTERCLFCRAYGSISESTCRRVTGSMYSKIHLISFQKLHCSLAEATRRKQLKTTYFMLCSTSNTKCHRENNRIALHSVTCSRWEDAEYGFGSIRASKCHHADWCDKVITRSQSTIHLDLWTLWSCITTELITLLTCCSTPDKRHWLHLKAAQPETATTHPSFVSSRVLMNKKPSYFTHPPAGAVSSPL